MKEISSNHIESEEVFEIDLNTETEIREEPCNNNEGQPRLTLQYSPPIPHAPLLLDNNGQPIFVLSNEEGLRHLILSCPHQPRCPNACFPMVHDCQWDKQHGSMTTEVTYALRRSKFEGRSRSCLICHCEITKAQKKVNISSEKQSLRLGPPTNKFPTLALSNQLCSVVKELPSRHALWHYLKGCGIAENHHNKRAGFTRSYGTTIYAVAIVVTKSTYRNNEHLVLEEILDATLSLSEFVEAIHTSFEGNQPLLVFAEVQSRIVFDGVYRITHEWRQSDTIQKVWRAILKRLPHQTVQPEIVLAIGQKEGSLRTAVLWGHHSFGTRHMINEGKEIGRIALQMHHLVGDLRGLVLKMLNVVGRCAYNTDHFDILINGYIKLPNSVNNTPVHRLIAKDSYLLVCNKFSKAQIMMDLSCGQSPLYAIPVFCPQEVELPDFGYIEHMVSFPAVLSPNILKPTEARPCNCRRWGICVCSRPPFLIGDNCKDLVECHDSCGCNCTIRHCKLRQVQRGLTPKLAVKYMGKGKGFGVVAMEYLTHGKLVGTYIGETIHSNALAATRGAYAYDLTPAGAPETEHTVVDSVHFGNLLRFVNHSCEPNCWSCQVYVPQRSQPIIAFFTSHRIQVGGEVCVDYGKGYFKYGLQCLCGSSKCISKINEESINDGEPDAKRSRIEGPKETVKTN